MLLPLPVIDVIVVVVVVFGQREVDQPVDMRPASTIMFGHGQNCVGNDKMTKDVEKKKKVLALILWYSVYPLCCYNQRSKWWRIIQFQWHDL